MNARLWIIVFTLLMSKSTFAAVVPYAPDSTPISATCAADLLEMLPEVGPIRASVVSAVEYSRARVSAELDITLKNLASTPDHFKQLVFLRGKSEVPRVTVTIFVAKGNRRTEHRVASPGHFVLSVDPDTADQFAKDTKYRSFFVEGIEWQVHSASFRKRILERDRKLTQLSRAFSVAVTRFFNTPNRDFQRSQQRCDGVRHFQLELRLAGAERPTVQKGEEGVVVTFSSATLQSWFDSTTEGTRVPTAEFQFDKSQIVDLMESLLSASTPPERLPVTLPFALAPPEPVETPGRRRRPARELRTRRLEGHPYRQVLELAKIYAAIGRLGIVDLRVQVPTAQGDRFIAPVSEPERSTEFGVAYEATTVTGQPDAFAENAEELFGPASDVMLHSRKFWTLGKFLGLEDRWSAKQIAANVCHQALVDGTFDGAFSIVPDWIQRIYRYTRGNAAWWLVGHEELAMASDDPSNWPWAVALLPPEQRAAYAAWLHHVPETSAPRLVEKHFRVLRAMTPEQVDAKLLGARP